MKASFPLADMGTAAYPGTSTLQQKRETESSLNMQMGQVPQRRAEPHRVAARGPGAGRLHQLHPGPRGMTPAARHAVSRLAAAAFLYTAALSAAECYSAKITKSFNPFLKIFTCWCTKRRKLSRSLKYRKTG